jgi:hypothetical protein
VTLCLLSGFVEGHGTIRHARVIARLSIALATATIGRAIRADGMRTTKRALLRNDDADCRPPTDLE